MTEASHSIATRQRLSDEGAAAEPAPRIAFANQLRGVAALLVVVLHLGVSFWFDRNGVAGHFGVAAAESPSEVPWFARLLRGVQTFGSDTTWLDFGALGVALFFLISGLVIPLSLQRLGARRFLLARAVRLLPVYVVSILLWLLVWRIAQYTSGGSNRPELGAIAILAKGLLVSDLLGLPQFDLVSWTLHIELKFYVVVAAIFALCRNIRFGAVMGFVGAATLATVALRLLGEAGLVHWPHPSIEVVVHELLLQSAFVSTIFCGQFFYCRLKREISGRQLALRLAAVQSCVVIILVAFNVKADTLRVLLVSQIAALAIFYLAMRGMKGRSSRLLDGLAQISYPLYVVHLPVGWFALVLMERAYGLASLSMAVALAAVGFAAWVVHRLVERPSLALIGRF